MAIKKEEKAKVGRPKLADRELIKDSWFKIGASAVVAVVMTICAVGIVTQRTPFQVLTFQNPEFVQASVGEVGVKIKDLSSSENKRVIPAKKAERRIIDANGNVTRVISPNPVRVIKISD